MASDDKSSVAVIIPYFGEGYSLGDILDDVYLQSALAHVFLVSDCGMSDPIFDHLCKRFGDRFGSRFRACCMVTNRGPAACRNLGLRQVSEEFEYVGFVDADDRWSSEHLNEQILLLKRFPEVILVCSSPVYKPKLLCFDRGLRFMELCLWNPIVLSSVVLKIGKENRFLDLFPEGQKYAEDYYAWLKLSLVHRLRIRFGVNNVRHNSAVARKGRLSQDRLKVFKHCFFNGILLLRSGKVIGGVSLIFSSIFRLFIKVIISPI
jgi:glycosyltransferase involved in cell wall biosynthesis